MPVAAAARRAAVRRARAGPLSRAVALRAAAPAVAVVWVAAARPWFPEARAWVAPRRAAPAAEPRRIRVEPLRRLVAWATAGPPARAERAPGRRQAEPRCPVAPAIVVERQAA